MAERKHRHHHSHSRGRFLRQLVRDSFILALVIAAALTVLLVMYCGIVENPNLLSLLRLALPAFLVVGGVVGVVNFLLVRRGYDKERN